MALQLLILAKLPRQWLFNDSKSAVSSLYLFLIFVFSHIIILAHFTEHYTIVNLYILISLYLVYFFPQAVKIHSVYSDFIETFSTVNIGTVIILIPIRNDAL